MIPGLYKDRLRGSSTKIALAPTGPHRGPESRQHAFSENPNGQFRYESIPFLPRHRLPRHDPRRPPVGSGGYFGEVRSPRSCGYPDAKQPLHRARPRTYDGPRSATASARLRRSSLRLHPRRRTQHARRIQPPAAALDPLHRIDRPPYGHRRDGLPTSSLRSARAFRVHQPPACREDRPKPARLGRHEPDSACRVGRVSAAKHSLRIDRDPLRARRVWTQAEPTGFPTFSQAAVLDAGRLAISVRAK